MYCAAAPINATTRAHPTQRRLDKHTPLSTHQHRSSQQRYDYTQAHNDNSLDQQQRSNEARSNEVTATTNHDDDATTNDVNKVRSATVQGVQSLGISELHRTMSTTVIVLRF